MGCGCSGGDSISKTISNNIIQRVYDPNCKYTYDILHDWYTKLLNVKNNGDLDKFNLNIYTLNTYLGTLQSALNYSSDYCYFSNELSAIYPTIKKIDEP